MVHKGPDILIAAVDVNGGEAAVKLPVDRSADQPVLVIPDGGPVLCPVLPEAVSPLVKALREVVAGGAEGEPQLERVGSPTYRSASRLVAEVTETLNARISKGDVASLEMLEVHTPWGDLELPSSKRFDELTLRTALPQLIRESEAVELVLAEVEGANAPPGDLTVRVHAFDAFCGACCQQATVELSDDGSAPAISAWRPVAPLSMESRTNEALMRAQVRRAAFACACAGVASRPW